MKNERQEKILQIISKYNVDTQEELLAHLKSMGVSSTQATVSRDIKQLHLVKQPSPSGGYCYAVSESRAHLNVADKQRTIFRECVVSVESAQNIAVVKTLSGMANAACAALDSMGLPFVIGTLAGDDTAFLVMRSTDDAENFVEEIRAML